MMQTEACVVYSDLVSWTKKDLQDQINSAIALFQTLKDLILKYNLRVLWQTSTGDGFAVAFPIKQSFLVATACVELHDRYTFSKDKVRIAISPGTVESYANPLLGRDDCTGQSIIKAKRILDGITGENVLLVEKSLSENIKTRMPPYMQPYFFSHPDINDKYGNSHSVVQILSPAGRESYFQSDIPPTLKDLTTFTKTSQVIELEKKIGVATMDGVALLWMSNNKNGLESIAIKIEPEVKLEYSGEHLQNFENIPQVFSDEAAKRKNVIPAEEITPNNPKYWLKKFRPPLSDRPMLFISIGKTDYLTALALEKAFDERVFWQKYVDRQLRIEENMPGLIAINGIVVTSDSRILFAQRSRNAVDRAAGTYSVSFEEQWNPLYDRNPYETVLRGLSEEFNLDSKHGVFLSLDNLTFYAIAREWGQFWNTVLIYLVKVPVVAERVLECWNSLPPAKDKYEHQGIIAIPTDSENGIEFLKSLLRRESEIDIKIIKNNGWIIAGDPTAGGPHTSTGRARILISLYALDKI